MEYGSRGLDTKWPKTRDFDRENFKTGVFEVAELDSDIRFKIADYGRCGPAAKTPETVDFDLEMVHL